MIRPRFTISFLLFIMTYVIVVPYLIAAAYTLGHQLTGNVTDGKTTLHHQILAVPHDVRYRLTVPNRCGPTS